MITPVSLLLGIIHCGTALLVMVLAEALRRGWIPRQGVFAGFLAGIEPESRRRAVSMETGRQYLVWSAVYLATGIYTLFAGLGEADPLIPYLAFGPLLLLVIPGLIAWYKA